MNEAADLTLAFYEAFFEAAADAIVVTGADGIIVGVNARTALLTGIGKHELIGRSVDSLVPERFRDHARRRRSYEADPHPRAMGRGLELVLRHADGSEIPVDIALTPFEVGGQRFVASTIRDFRGRAHPRDTLRVQATALRSAANGIVITDRNGVITWANPAACAITGYSAQELVGSHTRILKSGEHDAAFYAELWSTVMRGATWSGTITNRRKDGTLYYEEQTIAPVVDEGGAVTHFIAIKQDVTARRQAEVALAQAYAELEAKVSEIEALNQLLREQAIRDPLTGLYNRRYLVEAFARDVSRSARSGEPIVVASIDIDGFKQVNDTRGHAAGDEVLRALAALLQLSVRAGDTVCRAGGEEFVVLMPGASLEKGRDRADSWRRRFAALEVAVPSGPPLRCTMSIGVTVREPGTSETLEETLARADSALYAAKGAGRDRVVAIAPGAAT